MGQMISRSIGMLSLRTAALIGATLAIELLCGSLPSAGAQPQAHTLNTLYNFCSFKNCNDGNAPLGLVSDSHGNLFGMTAFGGAHFQQGQGTVYELRKGSTFKLLHTFCLNRDCSDGRGSSGPLIVDALGNVYGMTFGGGAHNGGVVFELSPPIGRGDWTYRKLYDFCAGKNCTDGAGPFAGLTYSGQSSGAPYDGASPLYGTTAGGGGHSGGTVFELSPAEAGTWSESVLYSFCSQGGSGCTDGWQPQGQLIMDAEGNLLGTTLTGGANHPDSFIRGAGVVFELRPDGANWVESVLYDFCAQPDCTDGAAPSSGLVQDASGNLFGVTAYGGAPCTLAGQSQTCGTVFELSADNGQWSETVVHIFCAEEDCRDGATPEGTLVLDTSGRLYGTTTAGGGNDNPFQEGAGTVFRLSGTTYKVFHRFCGLANCTDGALPSSGVILGKRHAVFGTTAFGGANPSGTIFEME